MKKTDLKNVEAIDVDFEEIEEAKEEVNYDEMISGLETKIKDYEAYQSMMKVIKMSDYPFKFELPKEGDKSKMVQHRVVKRTPVDHRLDIEMYEIITRDENDMPDEMKWLGKKSYTQENIQIGINQTGYYIRMYTGQLNEVIAERDSKVGEVDEG